MIGWISLHRKLAEKSFYSKDSEKVHLWIHLLLKANHKGKEEFFDGKIIHCNPGQFTTGRKQLSSETGISESKIQRILKYFEKIEQQIEQQTSNKNRLITIVRWDEYQKNEHQIEQQVNNKRTTSEQQVNNKRTHYNNDNNNNNENNEKKEDDFFKELSKPIDTDLEKKLIKSIEFIKDNFAFKNENTIRSFLSSLIRENKIQQFGKQTTDYFEYIRISKTDPKFKQKFSNWMINWENEDWELKIKDLKPNKNNHKYDDRITYM